MDSNNPPSAPPPAYGAVGSPEAGPPTSQYPQPGQVPPQATYSEPPPKYEQLGGQPPQGPYPPPQGGYPQGGYPPTGQQFGTQPQGYQGATIYPGQVHQTVVVTQPGYGPYPKPMECPNCHAQITTNVTYESGGLTWLSAGLLCLFGCWMGCCLIPFCIDDLQDAKHHCPNCSRHIGTFSRI